MTSGLYSVCVGGGVKAKGRELSSDDDSATIANDEQNAGSKSMIDKWDLLEDHRML